MSTSKTIKAISEYPEKSIGRTKFLTVVFIIFFFVCMFAGGQSKAYADFDYNIGVFLVRNNSDDSKWGGGFLIPIGYTSAEKKEYTTRGLFTNELQTRIRKEVEQFDYDILVDLTLGIPFTSAGGLFNWYLAPTSIGIGLGVGGGYAMEMGFSDGFGMQQKGPYIRGHLPIGPLGVLFDYFFFEEQRWQCGGYIMFMF
jgi:hypothetical protein